MAGTADHYGIINHGETMAERTCFQITWPTMAAMLLTRRARTASGTMMRRARH
jgi:hypothetical protein